MPLVNKPENKECRDQDCQYNPGGLIRPHYHVHTANGSYVKYIVEKRK